MNADKRGSYLRSSAFICGCFAGWCTLLAADLPPSLRRALPAPPVQVLEALDEVERRPDASGAHRRVGLKGPSNARQSWRQALRSPGAVGLRVHFTGFSVGGGRVWLHDGRRFKPQIAGPYTKRGIFGDGDFWSDVLYGEIVVIEYEPEGAGSFQIPVISHLWDRDILGPNPLTVAAVRAVHVAPMTGGLDKYLVEQIRAGGVFTVVSDADQADAFFSEGPGTIVLAAAGAGYPLWSAALPQSPTQAALRRLARDAVADIGKIKKD